MSMRGRQIASPIASFRYDCSSASMVASIVSNLATSSLLMMSVIAVFASNFRRKFLEHSGATYLTNQVTRLRFRPRRAPDGDAAWASHYRWLSPGRARHAGGGSFSLQKSGFSAFGTSESLLL